MLDLRRNFSTDIVFVHTKADIHQVMEPLREALRLFVNNGAWFDVLPAVMLLPQLPV
jgi:hypothetical protein